MNVQQNRTNGNKLVDREEEIENNDEHFGSNVFREVNTLYTTHMARAPRSIELIDIPHSSTFKVASDECTLYS